jgi:cell division protein FtsB
MRLGARLLIAVLLLVIAGVAISALFGGHGIAHLQRLRRERQDIGEAAVGLLRDNRAMREEITRLQTDDLFLEGLARRDLDLVRPGEIVYRFRRR